MLLPISHALLLAGAMLPVQAPELPSELLTVAEASGFTKTARHAEVVALCERIADLSDDVQLLELGKSHEGRSLPLLVLAKPPIRTAAEARERGNPIIFAFGNIHAGEVCGKEALTMLARDLALADDQMLLEELTLCIAPIYNADGNERIAAGNRPGQVGPDEMGQRPNAQGFDLNRDWVKLEAPETRAMVRFLTDWDPHLVIDTHTTNGSLHRYTLTYAAPLCPTGDAQQIAYVRDRILPEVTRSLLATTGYDSFFYGNFDADKTRWSTYSGQPRFGGPYRGLRGQMSILSEAYSYAPYEDRVRATYGFVLEILRFVQRGGQKGLVFAHQDWRRRFERAPTPEELRSELPIRFELASSGRVTIRGWVESQDEGGRRVATDEPRDYELEHFDHFTPTKSVTRPLAYALPPDSEAALTNLKQHGVRVEQLEEPTRARVEVYTIQELSRAERSFQGHELVQLEVDAPRTTERELPPGTTLVRTWQPLGNLAVYLLEPEAQDGLAAWNFFDAALEEGGEFPVLRVLELP